MASYDLIQLEVIKLEQLCQLSLKINSLGLLLDSPAAISLFAASATPAQLDKWNFLVGSKKFCRIIFKPGDEKWFNFFFFFVAKASLENF